MMKLNKRTFISGCLVVVLLLLIIILGIGFSKDKSSNESKTNEIEKKPVEVSEVKIVDLDSKQRPYAVMINNLNEARQIQSGLSEAYLVYELIVEGGITRFLALYQDTDTPKMGSVRSARHYYLDYVLENDAIFVHWGYSNQAKSDIKTLKINNINGLTYEGVYFYRDNPLNISSEHTGFTNMELLKNATNKLGYRQETDNGFLLDYSAKSVNLDNYGNAITATNVTLKYSNYTNNQYVYDKDTKSYKRYVNNKEHIDYDKKKQLEVKNIIVYKVANYTIAGDTKGRQFLENIGSGDGYFVSEGKAIKIKWSKKERSSKTEYIFENGEKLTVNDGNTFIQIMPETGSLVIE